ncbi:hypothetical protein CHARACLAT_025269 [Characodon lateralis]|uniref:Secreted protein n=1 Tax=Characodon lateralis TaxID=208331 RepID=A0ABU7F6Z2_9TELE|nr:hypothetical protein [Characodon lateralis]
MLNKSDHVSLCLLVEFVSFLSLNICQICRNSLKVSVPTVSQTQYSTALHPVSLFRNKPKVHSENGESFLHFRRCPFHRGLQLLPSRRRFLVPNCRLHRHGNSSVLELNKM